MSPEVSVYLTIILDIYQTIQDSTKRRSKSPSSIYKKIAVLIKQENEITQKDEERKQKQDKKFAKLQKELRKINKDKQEKSRQKQQKISEKLKEIELAEEARAERLEKYAKNKEMRASQVLKRNRYEISKKFNEQDLSYNEKKGKAMEHIKSMEEFEFRKSMQTLDLITNKLKKSEDIHESMINRRISEMRTKNENSMNKLQRYSFQSLTFKT